VAVAAVRDIGGGVHSVDTPELVMPVRVLIADGDRLVRAGLRAILEDHGGFSVVAQAATAEAALADAVRLGPDVVLIGAIGSSATAIQITGRIRAAVDAGVLVLVAGADDDGFAALRAGARGLILRSADPNAIAQAAAVVGHGGTMLAPVFASRLVSDFLSRPERLGSTPEELEELTAREREVMALVACGLSNAEIAARLVVTPATAKTHVCRALSKLNARDRAQLVVLAYECGLVRPGPRRAAIAPGRALRVAA
jgi:DNA-binding NarL/FixJ family response regulator